MGLVSCWGQFVLLPAMDSFELDCITWYQGMSCVGLSLSVLSSELLLVDPRPGTVQECACTWMVGAICVGS